MEWLKKEINELRNKPPTRNARVQDRIVNLPKHHIIYEKLLDVYTKLNLLEDSYMITDINLHISDNEDTFNEYFQADQKTKPKNKLYTFFNKYNSKINTFFKFNINIFSLLYKTR